MSYKPTYLSTSDISVQTMASCQTADERALSEEIENIIQAGGRIVRISVPDEKALRSFEKVTSQFRRKQTDLIFVADIHFNWKLAVKVAPSADKVRINPGNFLSIKESNLPKSDQLDLIRERISVLAKACTKHQTAVRIGLNGGSVYRLSEGPPSVDQLVETCILYIEAFRTNDFHNLVLSIKLSDPNKMIEANQNLYDAIKSRDWKYPIHLGVTESGAGMEGRIKSFYGIGQLLLKGIGNTIRISLAEVPVKEVIAGNELLEAVREVKEYISKLPPIRLTEHQKHHAVIALNASQWKSSDKWHGDWHIDYNNDHDTEIIEWNSEYKSLDWTDDTTFRYLEVDAEQLPILLKKSSNVPVLLKLSEDFVDEGKLAYTTLLIAQLLEKEIIAGFIVNGETQEDVSTHFELLANLLPWTSGRNIKANVIACPGCSRANIDLNRLTTEIQNKFGNRKGVQMSVMGCAVNGYGEMMQSDVAVLGKKNGKCDIYVSGEKLETDLEQEEVVEFIEHQSVV